MPFELVVGTITLLGMGLWLSVLSLRGRAVEGANECARCRHETDPNATASTCPECGGDLAAPRGVRPRRAPIGGGAVFGIMLIALGLVLGGIGLWTSLSRVSPWPSMPTSALSMLLAYGSDDLSDKAAAELAMRLAAGTLSDAETRAVATEVVARIEDRNRPLRGDLDLLAAMLRVRGLVPDASWGEFFARSIQFELLAPEKVRPESMICYGYSRTTRQMQFGKSQPWACAMRLSLVALRIGGVEIGGDRVSGMIDRMAIDGGSGLIGSQALLPALPRGDTTIEAEFKYEILDGDIDSEKVLLSTTLRLTKSIAVVGKDEPILEVVRDSGLAEEFRSAITLRSAKVRPQRNNGCMLELWLDLGKTPADAAFDVLLRRRDGGSSPEERALLTLTMPRARSVPSRGLSGFIEGFTPGRYDIVLRPSLERAEQAFGFTNAWLGEDIVIEDVELAPDEISAPASPSPESAR